MYHPNLLAHYRFESTQANLGIDASGNGNNLFSLGPVRVVGQFGNGVYFDGVNDYMGNTITPFNFEIGYTISMYINFNLSTSTQYIFSDGGTNGIRYNGSSFLVYTGTTFTALPYTKVSDNIHLVIIRKTATQYDFYVNAEYIGSCTSTTSTLDISIIGRQSGVFYFNGIIDELKFITKECDLIDINLLRIGQNPR